MAHGSEEDGDYWPGYVDALTSMVQVLAFVMMLLAMAVFVLSQNVAKSAVEAIAKAAKMDVPADADVNQLTSKVLEALEKQQKVEPTEAVPPPPPPPAATADATVEAPAPNATTVGVSPERRSSSRPVSREKPVEPASDAKRINLRFADRAFRIDQRGIAELAAFVGDTRAAESKTRLVIRAFASSADGALSEARRLAYYRAMTVRRELTERKIRPEEIRINVYDTNDKDQGSSVEIFTDGTADH